MVEEIELFLKWAMGVMLLVCMAHLPDTLLVALMWAGLAGVAAYPEAMLYVGRHTDDPTWPEVVEESMDALWRVHTVPVRLFSHIYLKVGAHHVD